MSACVLQEHDNVFASQGDSSCDFTCQTEGSNLKQKYQETSGFAVDSTCQTALPTRDVYCMARSAVGDVIADSANHRAPCVSGSPGIGQGDSVVQMAGLDHQLRRGFSDVTCQVDGAGTVSVHSQCDIHAHSGQGEHASTSVKLNHLRKDIDKKSSVSQCNIARSDTMTSTNAECQTTPTAVTSSHVMCQTPPNERVLDEGVSIDVWSGTDSTCQTEHADCDVMCQLDVI